MGASSSGGSPWRGPVLAAGGILLTAFAGHLPESVQMAGLVLGIGCCIAGGADIVFHWAKEKEWAKTLITSAKDSFSGTVTGTMTTESDGTKVVTVRPSELRSCLTLALPLVLVAALMLVINYFSGTNPETFAPPELLARQRVFVPDSLYDLSAIYRGRTEEEANLLFTVKAGKWIAVTGIVRDIGKSFAATNDISVHLSEQMLFGVNVSMDFDPKWKDRLDLLRIGDRISAYCKIDLAGNGFVSLNECELT